MRGVGERGVCLFFKVWGFFFSFPNGAGLVVNHRNSRSADICLDPGRGHFGKLGKHRCRCLFLTHPAVTNRETLWVPREADGFSAGNLIGARETRAGFPKRPQHQASTKPRQGRGPPGPSTSPPLCRRRSRYHQPTCQVFKGQTDP